MKMRKNVSFVLDVGEEDLQDFFTALISLPTSVSVGSDVKQLIDFLFPDLRNKYRDKTSLSEQAVLTKRNANLEEDNSFVGDTIPGRATQYVNADNIDNRDEREVRYPGELLNGISGTASLPNQRISFEKGYAVMLLQNLQPANGLLDGVNMVAAGWRKLTEIPGKYGLRDDLGV